MKRIIDSIPMQKSVQLSPWYELHHKHEQLRRLAGPELPGYEWVVHLSRNVWLAQDMFQFEVFPAQSLLLQNLEKSFSSFILQF